MNIHKLQCFNNPKVTQDFFHQLHHGIHTSTFQVTSLLPKSSNRRFGGHYPKALWISYFHNKCLNLPEKSCPTFTPEASQNLEIKNADVRGFPAFLQCATVLRTPWVESGEKRMHKPDHLAPNKSMDKLNKRAKSLVSLSAFFMSSLPFLLARHVLHIAPPSSSWKLPTSTVLNSATFPSADSFV